MEVVPSGSFLEEFTLIADRAAEEKSRFLIERKNGKHVVLLSMEDYNDMIRAIHRNMASGPAGQ